MPAWLKKIVLDIMPSVAATIIGAYIVNYYIIPKSPVGSSRASVAADPRPPESSVSEKSGDDRLDADKASLDKASFEKAVAEKTAIEKTAEKAATEKAANDKAATDKTEPRKQVAAPKAPLKSANAATTEPAVPAADVRRANDLARAAIDRLRGSTHNETPKPDAKVDASKMPDVPRVQPVSTVASAVAPQAAVPPMQPLPPAISVAAPNPDVFEQGNAQPVMRQPAPQSTLRTDESRRFAPPADIPSRPLDLRAQMSGDTGERTSIADEVVSTAKSMFHAVIPK